MRGKRRGSRTDTPNAATHTDASLSARLSHDGVFVTVLGGVALGLHTLTPTQARRLDLVGARVRQSPSGLRIDLGHFTEGDLGTPANRVRYPRGYAAPSLFVEWLSALLPEYRGYVA